MRIFILEDDAARIHQFREVCYPHVDPDIALSCEQIHKFQPPYDLILLDHDLGGRQLEDHEDSGEAFVELIKDRVGNANIIIHSYNLAGALRMAHTLREVGASVIRLPFGPELLQFIQTVTHPVEP